MSVDSKTLGPLSVPVAVIDRLGSVEPPEVEEEEEKPAEAETTTTPGQPGEEKPAEEGTSQPTPPTPIPTVRLVPPDKLPEAFRDRMKVSLETAVKRLTALEEQLKGFNGFSCCAVALRYAGSGSGHAGPAGSV